MTRAKDGSVGLLIDTQTLVWFSSNDKRLSNVAYDVMSNGSSELFVSAVVAWDFSDLERRGRFPPVAKFADIIEILSITVLDFPADAWQILQFLPALHRDPVDRMLIAHAIHADLTLITADAKSRGYPVKWIW